MATNFFLRSLVSSLGGAGDRVASQMRGRAANTATTTAVAGGTNIQVTLTAGGQAVQWFTEPISAAVTISGTVTPNIRGLENVGTVNAAAGVLIERCDNAGSVLSTIVPDTVVGLEYGTSESARTANITPTSTAMSVGERIKITLKVRNAGTMAAGTVSNMYNGLNTAATGDTYIRFTEDIITDEVIEITQFQGGGRYGYN